MTDVQVHSQDESRIDCAIASQTLVLHAFNNRSLDDVGHDAPRIDTAMNAGQWWVRVDRAASRSPTLERVYAGYRVWPFRVRGSADEVMPCKACVVVDWAGRRRAFNVSYDTRSVELPGQETPPAPGLVAVHVKVDQQVPKTDLRTLPRVVWKQQALDSGKLRVLLRLRRVEAARHYDPVTGEIYAYQVTRILVLERHT